MISEATNNGTISLCATDACGSMRHYDLQPDQGVFVGSSSNCGLLLNGDDIADIHCRVGFEDGKLRVQQWMSAEGTRVNGELIDFESELSIGDRIEIGRHQIVIGEGTASTKPDPTQGMKERANPVVEESVDEAANVSSLDSPISPVDHADHAEMFSESEGAQSDGHASHDESQELYGESVGVEHSASGFDDDVESTTDFEQESQSMDLDADFFGFEEEETYDRETVELLQAEIDQLRSALAERDAEGLHDNELSFDGGLADSHHDNAEASDEVLQRMQQLIDEANRSDERVALLEEMLHASEEAKRSEQEERAQLEGWVADIEQRIGQREEEHAAELDALRDRLEEATTQQDRLQRQLQKAAFSGNAPKQYEETLEKLQTANRELQQRLADADKKNAALEQRLEQAAGEQDRVLRDERANIAKEQAKVSRMRFELSSKLTEIEELPKGDQNHPDRETAHRIRTLREHLREIHEQEKKEEREASLATRLAKLWKRVDEY